MTSWSLARPPDSALDALGPPGQAVLPFVAPAQLGLDRRAYEPPAPLPAPSSPASPATDAPPGASLQLGPPHAVSQLTLFERLDVVAGLLGGGDHDRQAKCLRTRRKKLADVPIKRTERGSWSAKNLVTCGHWTCPSCGPYRARKVAATIGAAMKSWLVDAGDGCAVPGLRCKAKEDRRDVWMLTLTVPHSVDDPLVDLVAALYDASAHFFRTRTWESFAREHGVRARVRVLDVTFGGENGTHPHFHCALFLDAVAPGLRHDRAARASWLDDMATFPCLGTDRTLVDVWRESVVKAGIRVDDEAAFRDFAVKLSPSEEASAYFTKWGLSDEVAGSPLKRDNHLTLIDRCGAGDDVAGALFVKWRDAVEGKQWVTGLEDAKNATGITDEQIDAYVDELRAKREAEDAGKKCEPLDLVVRAHLWPRALQVGMANVVKWIEAREKEGQRGDELQESLDRFLWSVVPRYGAHRSG